VLSQDGTGLFAWWIGCLLQSGSLLAADHHPLSGEYPEPHFPVAHFFNQHRQANQLKLKVGRSGTRDIRAAEMRQDLDPIRADVNHGDVPFVRSELAAFLEGPQKALISPLKNGS
jgi:hypothetical protein